MTNKAGYVQHFAHFVYSVVHCEPNCGTVTSCLSGNIEWPKNRNYKIMFILCREMRSVVICVEKYMFVSNVK